MSDEGTDRGLAALAEAAFTRTEQELIAKARRSKAAHAKLVRPGQKYSHRKLIGWDIPEMVRDLASAAKRGCFYCDSAFASLGDMTFDIVGGGDWDYKINVVICCNRCNASKGNAGKGTDQRDTLDAWLEQGTWFQKAERNPPFFIGEKNPVRREP